MTEPTNAAVAGLTGARLGADLAEATTRASLLIGALADTHLGANYAITYNQYVLIAVLYNHEPTDVTDLARCLNVSKAAVSKRLPALERDELIHTGRDPHNLRRLVVTLTDKARGIVEKAGPEMETLLHGLLSQGNSSLDVAEMAAQMNKLSEILEQALGAQPSQNTSQANTAQ